MYMIKSRLKTREKLENMEIKEIFTNLHLKDGLGIEFTGELMPEGALLSFYRT